MQAIRTVSSHCSDSVLLLLQEVLQDVADVLPPIQDADQEVAHQWAFEVYSSIRMQLAVLPDALLQQVCGAVQGCSMDEVLQPLRQLRPVNGGPGWSEEIGWQLRGLNFDLSEDEEVS
jgi:hypothetical protein